MDGIEGADDELAGGFYGLDTGSYVREWESRGAVGEGVGGGEGGWGREE